MLIYVFWREEEISPDERVLYVSKAKNVDLFGDEEWIHHKGKDGVLVDGDQMQIWERLHCTEFEIHDNVNKLYDHRIYFNGIIATGSDYEVYYWINIFEDYKSSITNLHDRYNDFHNEDKCKYCRKKYEDSDDEIRTCEKQCFESLESRGYAEMESLFYGKTCMYAWSMIVNK
jgi:hypothetical protein